MESMRNDRSRRGWAWAVGAGLALTGSTAFADAPKEADSSTGIMTFANVQVVNAPEAVLPKSTASAQGMRVYVDQATRKIRPQSTEEALAVGAETKAKTQARSQSRTRTLCVETAAAEPEVIYGPGNTIGVVLTDEYLVYQVARKNSAGLEKVEVTGGAAAESLLKSSPAKSIEKEVGHAH